MGALANDVLERRALDLVSPIYEAAADPDPWQQVTAALFTADIPDPDLIIRTSGERRISNFLLWQSAYSEFLFLDKYWPDFSKEDLEAALREYKSRRRRYGLVEAS